MLLSMSFVFYPQGSANAAKFCAELVGQQPQDTLTAPFHRFMHVAHTSKKLPAVAAAGTATNYATRNKYGEGKPVGCARAGDSDVLSTRNALEKEAANEAHNSCCYVWRLCHQHRYGAVL
jgi:hypothetical protein